MKLPVETVIDVMNRKTKLEMLAYFLLMIAEMARILKLDESLLLQYYLGMV